MVKFLNSLWEYYFSDWLTNFRGFKMYKLIALQRILMLLHTSLVDISDICIAFYNKYKYWCQPNKHTFLTPPILIHDI